MAELADAADSKSADLRVLGVRLPLPAPALKSPQNKWLADARPRMRRTSGADAADFASYMVTDENLSH
jgi:hypothetical protein